MGSFQFYKPKGVEDLLKMKAELGERGLILAGGSNLLVYIRNGIINEGTFLDVKNLKPLKGIDTSNGKITIGAGETIREILESAKLREKIPFFPDSMKKFANPLIRSKATIGGNAADASPAADTAPPLLVLDTETVIGSHRGERVISIKEFFKGPKKTALKPDEVLLRFQFSVPEAGKGVFLKFGLRNGTAVSVTSLAAWLALDGGKAVDIRIALGGVAPTPVRAINAESALKGQKLNEESILTLSEEVEKDLRPISDVRGSTEYRKDLTVELLRRALRKLSGTEAAL